MTITCSNCSYILRPFMNLWPEVINDIMCSIGDRKTINFWNDLWVKNVGTLRMHHIGRGSIDDRLRFMI